METSASSSTGQIVAIIILVLIAVSLFVIFIVITVNIPTVEIAPFRDGSKVRIKSLANNLYLRPVACSNILGCTDNFFVGNACSSTPPQTIVAPVGQASEDETQWTLCEYAGISVGGNGINTGQAKYLVYSEGEGNNVVMAVNAQQTLVIGSVPGACKAQKTTLLECTTGRFDFSYFSFVLNEKTQGANNASSSSGSYYITNGCDLDEKLFCTGQGNVDQTQQGCPPVVVTSEEAAFSSCTSPFSPTCTLNYLFEIEVLPA